MNKDNAQRTVLDSTEGAKRLPTLLGKRLRNIMIPQSI